MKPDDALLELLARVGANHGAPLLVSTEELDGWPAVAVSAMRSQKVLTKARAAASVVCPGCEQACVMPVQVPAGTGPGLRAFVPCDKRSDINRVPVPIRALEQWQASGESIADLLTGLLSLRRPGRTDAHGARWEVGLLKGAQQASHLILLGDCELTLSVAGHAIRLADVLELKTDLIAVDRRMLRHRVDHPVAGGGDAESAAQRRDRLKAHVNAEKSKGTRGFLKVVAEEEGILTTRLKQILNRPAVSTATWPLPAKKKSRATHHRKNPTS